MQQSAEHFLSGVRLSRPSPNRPRPWQRPYANVIIRVNPRPSLTHEEEGGLYLEKTRREGGVGGDRSGPLMTPTCFTPVLGHTTIHPSLRPHHKGAAHR